MSRVFISHSHQDSAQAVALKTWLEQTEPGLANEIYLDLDPDTGTPAGSRWKDALRAASERCEAVICVLSQHWDDSHECKTEYRIAEDRGKPIFPVCLAPSTGADITSEWQRCDLFGDGPMTSISVDGHPEAVRFLTSGLRRLRNGLRDAGIAPDGFEWPPADDPHRAPYRGWQPLQAVDAAVYFGRDAQINRALSAIRELRSSGESRALVILGPSGVGKSSFLRAGLLPRLRRDDRHFLPMDIVRPERRPLTGPYGLARSLHSLRAALRLTQPVLGDLKACAADPARVRSWLLEAQHAATQRVLDDGPAPPPTIVLAIDQAEELFGAEAGNEASEFLTVVAGLLRSAQPPLSIVVLATIRSDRVEPLQTAPQLAGAPAPKLFEDLRPMPRDRYREVICGPAERAQRAGGRLRWSPDLVERLLADCAEGADALPLLSLTLARLYEDYGGGEVGLAEYEATGGMGRVVETEIAAVLSADPDTREGELARLRSAFIPWLATINAANDEPLRRPARWVDLPPESHRLIDALVAQRLLLKDERDGEVIVEVALESLLRQWDTLAGWLHDESADLKNTDNLEQAAQAWERTARRSDWLLEGERLTEAEALATKPGFRDRLNTTREYLLASRQREDRRAQGLRKRARVLRVALVLVAVVAVVAMIGFGWAFLARRDADARFRDATALRLYGESQLLLAGLSPGGSDDVTAIEKLLAALAIPSHHQGERYPLLTALQQERDLLKVIDVPAMVAGVAVSPDGSRIAAGLADHTVRLWDALTGKPIGQPLRGHDGIVTSVAFSPNGARLASGSMDQTVRLWDVATGQPIGQPLRSPRQVVTSVAFSPDGTRLASGNSRYVWRWDVATGQPIGDPLRGHDDLVSSVAFSPDGSRIVSGSGDKTVRLWDAVTGVPVGVPLRGHSADVMSVAFSPDGARIASGSLDFTARMWDAHTGVPVGPPLRHDNGVPGVTFSPDGRLLVSASADKAIRLWDVATSRQVGVLLGHRGVVEKAVFSLDGRRLVSGGDDNTVRMWDAASWQPLLGHDDLVMASFSEDGRRIKSSSLDKTARWWDAAALRPIGEPLRVDDDDVHSLWPIDGNRLLSYGSVNTVRLWDARTRQPLGEPLRLGPYDALRPIVYNRETHRIAARVSADEVRQWDVETMREVSQPVTRAGSVIAIEYSADGRTLATGDFDGTIQLWDADTGKAMGPPMTGTAMVVSMAFSADKHTLAAGYADSTVRLWDTRTWRAIGDPMHADVTVAALAFSPDGRTLASGSGDGTIRLWDTRDRVQLGAPLSGHTSVVASLDWSPDGATLLSGSADHTLRVWPVPAATPDALCAKLTHTISPERWNELVSPDIGYIDVCPGLPPGDDSG
ncbi:nSTAND1 domain-containing NTPase [Mycobacterium sp. 050134]|uniref:nSTAND1 domain-containing NTPase n=1 Tax=Mycobacterium sp. 050134 TaxID=3096111 RepID=UPI002EDA3F5E